MEFKRFEVKYVTPDTEGWYETDKGNLYYLFANDHDGGWSCREDRLSEEHPKYWYSKINHGEKTIIEFEKERMEWSLKTFQDSTAKSSLLKLQEEIKEIEADIDSSSFLSINEEYADALMCLFDSAGRMGITPQIIFKAFAAKLEKNKNRNWIKNPDNTYSHVKK